MKKLNQRVINQGLRTFQAKFNGFLFWPCSTISTNFDEIGQKAEEWSNN